MDYTAADLANLRANYLTLEQVCAERPESREEIRALIANGRLPKPSYVLDDGTELFPADYFRFVDEAGGPSGLRARFAERLDAAGGAEDLAGPAEADWRERLRVEVEELDALERQFAPDYDRDEQRFGRKPTRDLLIDAARERFPDVFAAELAAP